MRYILMAVGFGILYYAYDRHFKSPDPAAVEAAAPAPPPEAVAPPPVVLDEESLERIRATTRDSNPSVRWQAAQLLLTANDPQAMARLVEMLRTDEEPGIRRDIVGILASRPGKETTRHLIAALRDPEAPVRVAAIQALANSGDFSAATAISQATQDLDEQVRLEALRALSTLQQRRADEVRRIEDQRRQYEENLRIQAEQAAKKKR